MSQAFFRLAFFLASLLLALPSVSQATAPAETATISKESIYNRSYRCGDGGAAFVFANGAFAAKVEHSPGVFVNIEARIMASALGAATPDGKPGAAVIYTYTAGGEGLYFVLTLVQPKASKAPELIDAACTELGDRVRVEALKLENGQIVVDMLVHGANDQACCPTEPRTMRFSLKGDMLVEN